MARDQKQAGPYFNRGARVRALLANASLMALATAATTMIALPAAAQQVVPGNSPECPIALGEATCSGDITGGVVSGPSTPAFDILNVENPTGGVIAPAGIFGIGVSQNDRNVTLTVASDVTINTIDDPEIAGLAQGIAGNISGGFDFTIDTDATVTVDGNGAIAIGVVGNISGGAGTLNIINDGAVSASSTFPGAVAVRLIATSGSGASLEAENNGELTATSGGTGERNDPTVGLFAQNFTDDASIGLVNRGNITATASAGVSDTDIAGLLAGIGTNAVGAGSATNISNEGNIIISGNQGAGIFALVNNTSLTEQAIVAIDNTGDITTEGQGNAGLLLSAFAGDIDGMIENGGTIAIQGAGASGNAIGINLLSTAGSFGIINHGLLTGSGANLTGISVVALAAPSGGTYEVAVSSDGGIMFDTPLGFGIRGFFTAEDDVTASITNSGDIDLTSTTELAATGIAVRSDGADADPTIGNAIVTIDNSGQIEMGTGRAVFVTADDITLTNAGSLTTTGVGSDVVYLRGRDDDSIIDASFSADALTGAGDTIAASGAAGHAIRVSNAGKSTINVNDGVTVSGGTGTGFAVNFEGALSNPVGTGEVAGAVANAKAAIADNAMDNIAPFPTVVPTIPGMLDGSVFERTINLGDGVIESTVGAGGVNSDGSLRIIAGPGGAIRTGGDNAPVISAVESLVVSADGTVLSSMRDNSSLISLSELSAEAGTAAFVRLTDITATTTGANSHGMALGGSVGNSVAALFVRASDALAPSVISTTGDGSRAVSFDALGSSTFAGSIVNADISTLGEGASAVFLNGGDGSSLSLEVIDSTIRTEGKDSDVLSFGAGSESDQLLLLANSTLSSLGDNADGLHFDSIGGDVIGSTLNVVLADMNIATEGDNALGLYFGGISGEMTNSSYAVFIGGSDISTSGEGSHGLVLDGIVTGVGSSLTQTITGVEIDTTGAGAHGLVTGSVDPAGAVNDANSPETLSIADDVIITTAGADADALVIGRATVLSMPGGLTDGAAPFGLLAFDNFSSANGRDVANFGTLLTGDGQVITTGTGKAGNISNAGVIRGEGDVALRFDTAADIDDAFELQPGGEVFGTVEAGLGADSFLLGGVGIGSFDIGLIDDQYIGFDMLAKEDASTWTIMGVNDFVGLFDVQEGTLFANAEVAGMNFTVAAGAFLGGTGTLGSVTINGGTLAPGNSIGTITTGDLMLDASSIFEVEVNDQGMGDQVIVNGTVTLGGGTLKVLDLIGGAFAASDPYSFVIIANDGVDAVSGTFGTVTNELAFLTPSVSYTSGDGNDVALNLTPTPAPSFESVAQTYNQTGAASSLSQFDQTSGTDSNDVYMNVLFSSVPQALNAFDSSSGEVYASLLAGSLDNAVARSYRLAARAHHAAFGEGWGIWSNVNGRTASVDGDGNAADVKHGGYGFDIGVDYRGPDNGWALGASLGYLSGDLDVNDRRSKAAYDGWQIGGYGRVGTGGSGFTGSAAISYANSDADVTRSIDVNTISRVAYGKVDVSNLAVTGELRYGLSSNGGWAFGPIASVHHASGELGSFFENGAESLNLSSAGASDKVTRVGGGLFANWQGAKGGLDISAQYIDGKSNIAQVDVMLDGAPDHIAPVRSPITNGSGGLFAVAGDFEIGGGWTIGGNVRGLIGSKEQSAEGTITLGLRF